MNYQDYTKTSDDPIRTEDVDKALVNYVTDRLTMFKAARMKVEDTWKLCWAFYLSTPEALTFVREQTIQTIGKVNSSWRHKIQDGKAFEAVEQIHAYFMQAMFPNLTWFDVVPVEPGNMDVARVVRRYLANKLNQSNFRVEWEDFLRQLIVIGLSCILIEWDDKEKLVFECLNMFDIYIDPTVADPNKGPVIRRITKTRADVIKMALEGTYDLSFAEAVKLPSMTNTKQDKEQVQGWQGTETSVVNYGDTLELFEFWGDIHLVGRTYENVIVTICGDKLLRFEKNTYECGKPFVIGDYIRVVQQPYGMSPSQASLGLLSAQNNLWNQRLDNAELIINKMWTVVDDGTTDPADIYSEPGKIILVSDPNSVKPLDMGGDLCVSHEEHQTIERRIDQNYGTVPMVGLGQQRQAERVTATEVQAVRDAGGSRLSNVHRHIEDTALRLVLKMILSYYKQFMTGSDTVRIAGKGAGQYDYFAVDRTDFDPAYDLKPMGAESVLERQRVINDITNFVTLVVQIPQFAELTDWEAIYTDLLMRWGFDEPDKYLKKQESPPEKAPDELSDTQSTAQSIGGQGMVNAMQSQMAADGGMSQIAELAKAFGGGGANQSDSVDTAMQQQPLPDPAQVGL